MLDRDLPLKKEIAGNIKRLMDERRWTQLRLSEATGISKSTLSDYMNCKTLINPGNVEKVAEAFGVKKCEIDPSFLNGNVSESKSHYVTTPYIKLPVYGNISCGNGTVLYEKPETYEATPKSWLNGGEYFYLRAKGDSMTGARIYEGDLLLIRKQEEVENGEIAAVVIDGESVLKRVYKNGSSFILQSENPDYPPMIYNPENDKQIMIIGKLKKVILNF
jgi:repressor LexA